MKTNARHHRHPFCCALILVLLWAVTALGQQSGSQQLTQAVIAGGGGASEQGNRRIEGTIGQPATGASTNGAYAVMGGFWGGDPALCPAPFISQQPSSQIRCVGGAVTFSVAATGEGLSFQWRKNGTKINGATSDHLTFSNLVAGDTGAYDVFHGGWSECTATVTVTDTIPPTITCPASVGAMLPNPSNTSMTLTLPAPTVNDNVIGASFIYTPGSGPALATGATTATFPRGATTVTAKAIDQAGNLSTACSFTVTVADTSVQDNTTGDVLLFNTQTGAYYYRRCSTGLTISGVGQVTTVGCTVRLTANSTNRVTVTVNKCQGTATATITTMSPVATYTLTDSNMSNNSHSCPGS